MRCAGFHARWQRPSGQEQKAIPETPSHGMRLLGLGTGPLPWVMRHAAHAVAPIPHRPDAKMQNDGPLSAARLLAGRWQTSQHLGDLPAHCRPASS